MTEDANVSQADSNIVEFGDHIFTKNEAGLWDFNVANVRSGEEFVVTLRKLPMDVSYVSTFGDVESFYRYKDSVNLVFDPAISGKAKSSFALAMVESTLTLNRLFNVNVDTACRTEDEACKQMAESCDAAETPMIEFVYSNTTMIEKKNNNCVILYGDENTIFDATEKMLYLWYKVLK